MVDNNPQQTPSKKTLCLVMIVRNESKVIQRCLNRVKDHIDYWVIVDTGSTDNTKELIKETLQGVPGELHEEEWINFGHNRSQSLQFAKGKADYLLLCDADEQIIFSAEFDSRDLTADSYLLYHISRDITYAVTYLIKGDLDWHYVGVTHEYLDCSHPTTNEVLPTLSILDLKDGGFKTDKYERDIKLLTKGLEDEPDNSRYKFYLANSYRDIEQYEDAIKWYKARIKDGGWIEEVTCSYESLGKCYRELGKNEEALYWWLIGYDRNPKRAECLYYAVQTLRIQSNHTLAHKLALIAKQIPYPASDILFVNKSVYDIWIDYELSITSSYNDDSQLGYDSCKKILFSPPNGTILLITARNLRFYVDCASKDEPKVIQAMLNTLNQLYGAYPEDAIKASIDKLSSLVN